MIEHGTYESKIVVLYPLYFNIPYGKFTCFVNPNRVITFATKFYFLQILSVISTDKYIAFRSKTTVHLFTATRFCPIKGAQSACQMKTFEKGKYANIANLTKKDLHTLF